MGGTRRLFQLGLWGPAVDEGVEWEIEHHIQERADELEAEGLTREEAEAEARRRFGDITAVRRELRAEDRAIHLRARVTGAVETLIQDLRFALRGIGRSPGFAATLVVTLGLGIGATVAAFGIVDALLLRPLPYADPGDLYNVEVQYGEQGWRTPWLPVPVTREWLRGDHGFGGLLAHDRTSKLWTDADPQVISAHKVAPRFEEVLGVAPALGRGFVEADANAGAEPVALVSHRFWRAEFGGDPEVVGRSLRLDGVRHTVIGIMPAGFKFPEYSTTAVWLPLPSEGELPGRISVVARVSGEEVSAAEARASTQVGRLHEALLGQESVRTRLMSMEGERGGGTRPRQAVLLLFGAGVIILLVAAVNAANLLLVRGADRSREIAVRHALGASRGRMLRQLLTESLVMVILSGAVAIAVAWLATAGLRALMPADLVFWMPHELSVGPRSAVFAFAAALVAGTGFALLPALRSSRPSRAINRSGMSRYGGSQARSRLRRGLVVAEVALSVILLAGGGLLMNSFLRLMSVDVGIETEGLALMDVPVTAQAQPDSAGRATFLPRLLERIRALPGVTGAMVTGPLPDGALRVGVELQAEGQPPAGNDPDILPVAAVPPEFFEVSGARLLAGRSFRSSEEPGAVIVDEDLARHLWPDEDPVGRRFRTGEDSPWMSVVGVMNDMQIGRRDNRWGDFEILRPFDQAGVAMTTVAVRVAGDPAPLFPTFRGVVRELAPNQPVAQLVRAEAAYGEVLQLPRFLAVLVTALAGFALVLAAVGLFGVLAYEFAQRRREIGIRAAMGATASEIRRMVLIEGVGLAVVGTVVGLVGTLALGGLLESVLFELEPTDPMTFLAVAGAMGITTVLASYLPARRATRVDPAEVLRGD